MAYLSQQATALRAPWRVRSDPRGNFGDGIRNSWAGQCRPFTRLRTPIRAAPAASPDRSATVDSTLGPRVSAKGRSPDPYVEIHVANRCGHSPQSDDRPLMSALRPLVDCYR